MTPLILLPRPQNLIQSDGVLRLPSDGFISLRVSRPAELLFAGRQIQSALDKVTRSHWQIAGGAEGLVTLAVNSDVGHREGYTLDIDQDGVRIIGGDLPGAYYGAMTFKQLLQTHGSALPFLHIEDFPDFPSRGVMLDVSRDSVPTMDSLYDLVDMLAGWKVNQIQLYTEHTFAYQNHRAVWQHASPFTAEEILSLDAFCRQRFIDLVPCQNSFGHMDRWFKHPAYLHLGETQPGYVEMWGRQMKIPFSLSPAVPQSLEFVNGLYQELLPNFTSGKFNVCCDETFDLGLERSKALVEEKGKGRVYLDFVLKIYDLVKSRGLTMMYWGDIINQYPALVPQLPKDAIALEWGYEGDHDFPAKTKLYADAGVPYYVCPGTSSWHSTLGRTDNCVENIRQSAIWGLKNGALGFLNTDWGDEIGVRHYQPVSYAGFAYGAAVGWSLSANADLNLPAVLDRFVFQDAAGQMGQIACDLGNAYQKTGVRRFNGALLYFLNFQPLEDIRKQKDSGDVLDEESKAVLMDDARLRASLHATIEYIDETAARLDDTDMACPDAALIKREFVQMARFAKHGAKLGLLQLRDDSVNAESVEKDLSLIESEYPDLWLARRRPGGLADSFRRIQESRSLCQQ